MIKNDKRRWCPFVGARIFPNSHGKIEVPWMNVAEIERRRDEDGGDIHDIVIGDFYCRQFFLSVLSLERV